MGDEEEEGEKEEEERKRKKRRKKEKMSPLSSSPGFATAHRNTRHNTAHQFPTENRST
jgi:hypothetical protein